jgi:hypothetical protein
MFITTPIELLALKEHEDRLIAGILVFLDAEYPDDSVLIRQRFEALKALEEAVSRFPSARDIQMAGGVHCEGEDIIEFLSSFAPSSRLLHTPTKIVAARSFLVAKCHAFSLVAGLVKDREAFFIPLRRIILSLVCTILAEDVYFSCLDDPAFPTGIKMQVANDLISLWDTGTDPRITRNLSDLEALWRSRDETPPCFGTMDGSSELMRISLDMGEAWNAFLVEQVSINETRWALEEFLFGLSYEEILEVRSRLTRFGILAVDHAEVRSYLGSKPGYTITKNADPRAIYDFYIDRRDAAAFRKRSAAPGPQRTVEELYLKYRLLRG